MMIYTVTITPWEGEPMTSAFSTREKAEAFAEKIRALLEPAGCLDWEITIDSDPLDSESYLGWIRDLKLGVI